MQKLLCISSTVVFVYAELDVWLPAPDWLQPVWRGHHCHRFLKSCRIPIRAAPTAILQSTVICWSQSGMGTTHLAHHTEKHKLIWKHKLLYFHSIMLVSPAILWPKRSTAEKLKILKVWRIKWSAVSSWGYTTFRLPSINQERVKTTSRKSTNHKMQ